MNKKASAINDDVMNSIGYSDMPFGVERLSSFKHLPLNKLHLTVTL